MMNILIILITTTVYSFIIYLLLKNRLDSIVNNKKFLREVREEVSSLITQINETSDRNVTLLENRLERLTSLLDEADNRISSLKLSNNVKVENVPTIKPPKAEPIKVVEGSNKTKSSLDIDLIDDKDDLSKKDRILLLHKQGISNSIIAKKTESTIGEVELIITLNRG